MQVNPPSFVEIQWNAVNNVLRAPLPGLIIISIRKLTNKELKRDKFYDGFYSQ